MKRLRASWFLSACVAALAVYTFLDYRKSQSESSYAEDERAPFTMKSDQLDSLRIHREQDPIELRKREDGQWMMVKPVEDDVEEASALSFILSLTTQRVRLFNPQGEKAETDWAKYGLQPPAVTFEIGAGKESEALSLSSKNAFDGSFYLRQKEELLVGDTGFAQLNARSSNSFRSRLLWREKKPVEKAEVELERGKYALVKKNGEYALDPKPAYPVDNSKIEAWLERLQEFKPAEIVKDQLSDEDKRALLLLVPSAKILVNGSWLLTIGQDRAQDVFLYTSQRPTVFKASVQGLSQIRVPAAFFRDGRKPFEFAVEKARRIEVRSGKRRVVIKKTDTGWVNEKGVEIGTETVALMQDLRGLEAREFPVAGKTGLAAPQVVVEDGEGKNLLELSWGDEYTADAAYNNGVKLRYARTNLEKDLLGVSSEKLTTLLDILAIKEPEKK